MDRTIEDFVRGLGLDAYLVGGAVRDEFLGLESKDADFVVPGVDYEGLRKALEPYGRVEDLEVAGRRVGARLYPRDKTVRAAAPAGIEFAPPRSERSTGPGRHDFEIVADPGLSIEDDMARRDFTVNAMARRLENVDALFARRFLREHGDALAFDLVTHKEADLRGKQPPQEEFEAVARLRTLLEQEQDQPHRLRDLAIDGADLIELGYEEGPALGRTLESLLDAVVDDPTLNTRAALLERARRLLT